MARPEQGKAYLIVTCRSCNAGFRVVDAPLEEAAAKIDAPQSLTCRGCGHVDVYEPRHMRPAYFAQRASK